MSRQSKQRNKQYARELAKTENRSSPSGASGMPSRQLAPPWVSGGNRRPKKARENEQARRAAEAEAKREALKARQKSREVSNET